MTLTHDTDGRCSQPTRRTLRPTLLRVLVPRIVVFGFIATVLGLGRLLSVDASAQPVPERLPVAMPSWTAADQRAHPGCVPSGSWPEDRPAGFIVAYSFRDHARRKVSFARAWQMNHNHSETDDVWVLGVCPDGRDGSHPDAAVAEGGRKAAGRRHS